jgi:sugar transferase (PEP-CTERM/EpsH1 system associated)
MRILLLTPSLPFPPHRGDKLKIFNLVRNLSLHHDIVLLTFSTSRKDDRNIPAVRQMCADVLTVRLPVWQSILQCGLNVFSRRPFQVAYFTSGRMRRLLARILSEQHFDVVHTHFIRMAQYTSDLKGIPRILDLTDAVSLYLERFLATERNVLKRILLKSEYTRMLQYERIIRHYDRTMVCSVVDRKALLNSAPDARVEILENGVDLDFFKPDDAVRSESGTIICTGNMSYFPNANAVQFFAEEIFPLVKRRVPGAKFLVVGQNPPGSVRRLASPDVVVTGTVPDIRPYYLKSVVAVSPVRFGSGTLNKVLEPMALGIPVVATPVGTEGLPIRSGEHLLIAESPADFADRVVELLNNPDLRRRLSSNALELVRTRYGWPQIASKLEQAYGDIAQPNTRM